MPSENVRSRVRRAIVESLWVMELPGFLKDSIAFRKQGIAADMVDPAIVVTKGPITRLRSPAGMRLRTIEALVSVYWKIDGSGQPDHEDQEGVIETIMAAFDLPPEMPAPLTAIVPEAQEIRVTNRDEFLETAFPYKADVHRFMVSVEVCQAAGVA